MGLARLVHAGYLLRFSFIITKKGYRRLGMSWKMEMTLKKPIEFAGDKPFEAVLDMALVE